MEEEDLIKKLESIDFPEVEIKGYKKILRIALLNSYYSKKMSFFEIFKKSLVFSVPALALLLILGITIIQPNLTEAKALSIAKANPEIKKLMENNSMSLGEVKVKNGKAYILLNLPEEAKIMEKNSAIKIRKAKENAPEDIEGAIIEISLNQKEVNKINLIKGDDVSPLADEERESAKEIIESEEIIKEIIPKGAEIGKIQSSLPREVHLIERDHEVQILPSSKAERKVRVQYILDGKKWVIKVNLDEKRVEEIEYSSSNKEKGRD